ncbi:MAG: polysaccharide deacetylase family protein [Rhizobiales bacterium]|nr:polysaccharide deacetylase family protein [Hyphomicrobiales bacterium]
MAARASLRKAAFQLSLDALYFTGAFRALRGRCAGAGVILTLHHVRPARRDAFQPNRSLEVTPEFLDGVIETLGRQGLEFIGLDELHRRLRHGSLRDRVACLTFDDGYRDNLEWAYPVLRRHRVPFAIFVASDLADRRGHMWWRTLETAVSAHDDVTITIGGTQRTFICRSLAEKIVTVQAIHRALGNLPSETAVREAVDTFAARMGIDPAAQCAAVCMGWEELAMLAADPLVMIGAHTMSHPRLAKLGRADARHEMQEGAARIEAMIGIRPRHLAYPFGDEAAAGPREFALAAELGFKTAVTTRPGVLTVSHRDRLTALPRISLNGEYQRLRHLRVLESGVATAAWNNWRRFRLAAAG